MKNKKAKKLNLESVKVKSFTTSFETENGETKELLGGQIATYFLDCPGTYFTGCQTMCYCPHTQTNCNWC
ncbi:MAG: pinensin family lanthipeptide [Bacteroidota bacterium]